MKNLVSTLHIFYCYLLLCIPMRNLLFRREFLEVGYLLGDATKLSLHICLLIAAIIACNQTRKLDINAHPISLLDDVLLYICLPAFFMETILSMVATINILNVVKTIDFVVMVRNFFFLQFYKFSISGGFKVKTFLLSLPEKL